MAYGGKFYKFSYSFSTKHLHEKVVYITPSNKIKCFELFNPMENCYKETFIPDSLRIKNDFRAMYCPFDKSKKEQYIKMFIDKIAIALNEEL